ncbi:hypothetical protein GQ457_05G001850 [Hibiscus cannabinus]
MNGQFVTELVNAWHFPPKCGIKCLMSQKPSKYNSVADCLIDETAENRGCYSLQLKKTQNADQTASQVEQHLAKSRKVRSKFDTRTPPSRLSMVSLGDDDFKN